MLRCVGMPCGCGRDRARKWGSEAVRLRVEVERRAGMFGLEPWQVRRHAWVEAMMRGRGEWDASGISAGCADGGRSPLCVAEGPEYCKPGLLGVGGGAKYMENFEGGCVRCVRSTLAIRG
jgi:hypothetical protein